MMNWVVLGVEAAQSNDPIGRFAEAMVGSHEVWQRLSVWRSEEGQRLRRGFLSFRS